jgi:hypothetical protein
MGFEVLSGLFWVDARRIKLFYIPVSLGSGGPQASVGGDDAAQSDDAEPTTEPRAGAE